MYLVGSVYQVNIIVGSIPARALVDTGSQVCITRK